MLIQPRNNLGHGVGLRSEHFNEILETKPKVDWFEAISENFMDTEGRPLHILEKIRADYPVVLHGTSLSIGSAGGLSAVYLEKLKKLADRIQPAMVSDHLCWADHGGKRLFDLLPLPFTEESLKLVVRHVDQLQSFLGRRILLENVSAYIAFKHSEMTEWDFLDQVAKRSGCGILLDVNNIYVNSFNHGFDPLEYLNGISPEHVFQYHISGHTDKGKFLFDTHVGEIIDPVWQLYATAVRRFGDISSLIEWDSEIGSLDQLIELNEKSRAIAKQSQTGDRRPEAGGLRASSPRVSGLGPKLDHVQSMFASEILKKSKTALAELLEKQAGDPGIERVEVYAEGYPARIRDALLECYPAIHKVLGEGVFTELALEFAGSRSFDHYNLSRAADHFPVFLQMSSRNEEFPFLRDLAQLEKSVQRSFHAEIKASATGVDFAEKAASDGENVVFQFQPHVFAVRSFWPILDIWNARNLPPDQIKIQVEGRAQAVLIYRRGEQVVCQKAEALEAAILQSLMDGNPLGKAFDVMTEADDMTPVQGWFSSWLANGLIASFEQIADSK